MIIVFIFELIEMLLEGHSSIGFEIIWLIGRFLFNTGPINRNEVENCCDTPLPLRNPFCFEIEVPEDDYFYHKFNIRCQDFVRSFPGLRPDCKLGTKFENIDATEYINWNRYVRVLEGTCSAILGVACQLDLMGCLFRITLALSQHYFFDPMKIWFMFRYCIISYF